MELSGPKIKKVFYIFSKKAFLIFWEMELFLKTYISGGNFPSLQNKNHSEKISYISGN